MNKKTLAAIFVLALFMGGCVTNGMSYRNQSALTGAALGGVGGAIVTDGGVFGTVGGAALGALIGDQLGKHNRYDRRDYNHRRHNRRDYRGHRGHRPPHHRAYRYR